MTVTAGILLALDPSIRSCGVALFADGVLYGCAKLRGLDPGVDRVHRCRAMARAVYDFTDGHPDRIAVEWPRVLPYGAKNATGQPNDLFALAGICAAVATLWPGAEVKSYLMDEWPPAPKVSPERKRRGLGPIDSEAFTSPRGKRVVSRLSTDERALVPMSHDAVDAVGIGLHALGRLEPHKVYPGAVRG